MNIFLLGHQFPSRFNNDRNLIQNINFFNFTAGKWNIFSHRIHNCIVAKKEQKLHPNITVIYSEEETADSLSI